MQAATRIWRRQKPGIERELAVIRLSTGEGHRQKRRTMRRSIGSVIVRLILFPQGAALVQPGVNVNILLAVFDEALESNRMERFADCYQADRGESFPRASCIR